MSHGARCLLLSVYDCCKYIIIVAAYNPYDNLTVRAIIKLEMAVNIPVLTKLEPQLNELSLKSVYSPFDAHAYYDELDLGDLRCGREFSKTVRYIHSWVKQWNMTSDSVLPSWKNFYAILREMSPELAEVADQIEVYFDLCLIQHFESENKSNLDVIITVTVNAK